MLTARLLAAVLPHELLVSPALLLELLQLAVQLELLPLALLAPCFRWKRPSFESNGVVGADSSIVATPPLLPVVPPLLSCWLLNAFIWLMCCWLLDRWLQLYVWIRLLSPAGLNVKPTMPSSSPTGRIDLELFQYFDCIITIEHSSHII